MTGYLRHLLATPGFPSPGMGIVSYQGVPIVFQDDQDSSIWKASPLARAHGVTRVAVHAEHVGYVIRPV